MTDDTLAHVTAERTEAARSVTPSTGQRTTSRTLTFEEFYKARETARKSDFQPKKKMQDAKSSVREVEVKVSLAYRRGKLQLINAGKEELLKKAMEKHAQFDQTFEESLLYTLLYPDFSHVQLIPGTNEAFSKQGYKKASGKDYKRLTFYLTPR